MPRSGRALLVGLLCALCDPAVAYADVADYLGKPVTSVRLVLGGRDLLLTAGEVVEFDTRTPHWVGNPGPDPVEAIAIYGPQGERMHVRS